MHIRQDIKMVAIQHPRLGMLHIPRCEAARGAG